MCAHINDMHSVVVQRAVQHISGIDSDNQSTLSNVYVNETKTFDNNAYVY